MSNSFFNSRYSDTFKAVDFIPVIGLLPHFIRATRMFPSAETLHERESTLSKVCLIGYYGYQLGATGYAVIKGLEALQ